MRSREPGALSRGAKFLKYEIEAELGRGGHACVYQALDSFLGRRVAVKVLHRAGGVSEELLRRGQLEAQLLVRLRHPNIVEVIDAGVSDQGQLYIVMELLRGQPLRSVLRQHGRLRVDEALPLFRQVAEGIELAHRQQAIHRDLKPENIFVCPENRPKVLDFGIAKVAGAVGITTQRDLVHGTMLYMSPEQLQGVGATPRSDVYALGTVIYEAISGRHPCILLGEMPSIAELARIQTFVKAPPIDQLDPTIPRHVARVITRAIAKHPDDRFQSMTELADALAEAEKRFFFETGSHALGPLRDLSMMPSSGGDSLSQVGAPGSAAHTFEPLAVSPGRFSRHDTEASGPPSMTSDTHGAEPLVQRTERLHRDELVIAPPKGQGATETPHVTSTRDDPTPSMEPHVSPLPEPASERRSRLAAYAKPLKLGALAGVVFGVGLILFASNGAQPSLAPSPLAASSTAAAPRASESASLFGSLATQPLSPLPPAAPSLAAAFPSASAPLVEAHTAPTPLPSPKVQPLAAPRVRPTSQAKPSNTKKTTPDAALAGARSARPAPNVKPEPENPFAKPFAFPDPWK